MEKVKSRWSLLRLFVVSVLLLSFISSSLNISSLYNNHVGYTLVKKIKASNEDSGIPIEENEKEVEDRSEETLKDSFFLISFLRSALILIQHQSLLAYHQHCVSFLGSSASLPIYLAKRSLLI